MLVMRILRDTRERTHEVAIGPVERLSVPDCNGCNWYVAVFGNIRDHVDIYGRALAESKGLYNLPEV